MCLNLLFEEMKFGFVVVIYLVVCLNVRGDKVDGVVFA